MTRKIVITGGNGSLAQQIISANDCHDISSPSRADLDITSVTSIRTYLDSLGYVPDILIHAAAMTRPMSRHHVEPVLSIQSNIIGTSNIVAECIARRIKIIYISTDYVYPGTEGNYAEDSPLLPYGSGKDGISKYGWSKLGGECAVRLHHDYLIVRACICGRPFPHSKALSDVRKSFMYNDEAAKILLQILDQNGVVNLGGPPRTVYEFAAENCPETQPVSRLDLPDALIAPDTTMNVEKLSSLIGSVT